MNTVIIFGTIRKIHQMGETLRGVPCVTAFVKVRLSNEGSTTTLTISAYGNMADRLAGLHERDSIIVEGSLNAYVSRKDGTPGFEVQARRITLVSSKSRDSQNARKEQTMTEETPTIIEGVEATSNTLRFISARHGEQRSPKREWLYGRAVKQVQPSEENEVTDALGQ